MIVRAIEDKLRCSVMLVPAVNPQFGFDNAAKVAKHGYHNNRSLRHAVIELAVITGEQFDDTIKPEEMVGSLKI